MVDEPFMMYRFQGFKFEFIRDYILITDERNKFKRIVYKFEFGYFDDTATFIIKVIEK